MRIKRLIFIVVFTLLWNCERNKTPLSPHAEDLAFAIYFLQDENLKMKDIYGKHLSKLKLSNIRWLCDKDIRFYDWSSHLIYLKEDKTHLIPGWQKGKRFNVFPEEWADKPLVVTANGKKCYLGYFSRAELSTRYWIAPMLEDIGANGMYPSDVVWIDWIWLYHDTPQNNQDVKNALINSGLYHGGISITFDTTDAILNIENADTSTITYKFTITNNDEDDLYVIDPDKTGSGLFHRFTNGPVFKNLESGKLYESRWKTTVKPPSPEYWSPEWFTKLKSGQSIQRTVILKGYPYFPTGEYIFEFKYSGPPFNMEKEARELSDGRYWFGPTRSNILVMVWEAENDSLTRKNVTRQYFLKNKPQRIYNVNKPYRSEYLHISSTQKNLN